MPLSKSTTDQINREADDFGFQVPYNGTNKFYNDDRLKGYIAGATVWAEKAAHWKQKAAAASIERDNLLMDKEGLVKALESIKKWDFATDGRKFDGNHKEVIKQLMEIATKALEQYK